MVENLINRKIGRGFEIVLFIALMGASMLGAQMLSFSLNKLALIPLEIYLVWYVIKNKEEIRISKFCIPLLIFYFAQFAGSIVGLLNTNFRQQYLTYYDRLSNNLLQVIFFYIPILIFLSSVNEKNRIYLSLKKCIVLVARIHMIWVFVQFIAWYIFDLDFNEFVFQTIFNNFFGELFSSSTVIHINGSTQLRATGLNREPAWMG